MGRFAFSQGRMPGLGKCEQSVAGILASQTTPRQKKASPDRLFRTLA
jgi:hypothetical protein